MRITSREMDVLSLVGQRLDNSAIAATLVLSRRTVEGHISNLLAKTATADRASLIAVSQASRPDGGGKVAR
jgi:DNA-binding NarL/FixJ family response regulator